MNQEVWNPAIYRRAIRCAALLVLALTLTVGASAQEIDSDDAMITLATFDLGVDHTAEFLAFPDRGEVAYIEIGRGTDAQPLFERFGELPTLEAFLVLAPEDAPLPRLLVENHRKAAQASDSDPDSRAEFEASPSFSLESLIAERGIVETVGAFAQDLESDAVQARLARYTGLAPSTTIGLKAGSTWGTGGWNCADSAADFANFACSGSGGSGRIDFCHSGATASEVIHNSFSGGWLKRKYSFGITAACNDSIDVAHDWWNGTSWKNTLHVTNLPSGYWMWHRYQGTGKYYRRVLHRTTFHTGFHRSYSAFYD